MSLASALPSVQGRTDTPATAAEDASNIADDVLTHSESSNEAPSVHSSSLNDARSPMASLSSPSRAKSVDPNNVDWTELNVPRFLLISSTVSIAENAFVYPFYLIKTREQVERGHLPGTSSTGAVSSTGGQTAAGRAWHRLTSAISFTRTQVQDATKGVGMRGLYRGFWVSSLGHMPPYALYLMLYSYSKHALGWTPDATSAWMKLGVPLVSGVFADVAALSMAVPVDVISQRLQLRDNRFRNAWHAARSIVRDEGVRGLYRGTGAALAYSAVGSAVWWSVYENVKSVMLRRPYSGSGVRSGTASSADKPNRGVHVAAGFLAGLVTATIVNPLDIVTTRLQTQQHLLLMHSSATSTAPAGSAAALAARPVMYRNMVHGFREMVRQEGLRSFTRGLLPNIAYKAPLSALSSLLYELTFHYSRKPAYID